MLIRHFIYAIYIHLFKKLKTNKNEIIKLL